MMDNTVGDFLHCEEQLKTTLQYDDKEKLRQKLFLLQREYVRTAQRLQRAERSDGVRKPVVSHVKQPPPASQGENGEQEVRKTLLTLTLSNGLVPGGFQDKDQSKGIVKSANSHSINPQLPSDAPHTTDAIHGPAGRHRPSSASQFRSRLSRQSSGTRRLDSVENRDGSKLNRIADTCLTKAAEGPLATDASQREELHSGTDSDSPSLLLTHWNTVHNKKGCIEDRKIHGESEQREKGTGLEKKDSQSKYVPQRPQNTELNKAGGHSSSSNSSKDGIVTGQTAKDRGKCEDSQESTAGNGGDESEKVERDEEVKGAGLLDSCTLVEGLLFPAEYYVRTTRRMASLQSQPDMQAVILGQLNLGRPQRGRGGAGRRGNRKHESSGGDSPAAANRSASGSPPLESQDSGTAAVLHSLTSSDGSDHLHFDVDAASSPLPARPMRGKRRKRGRPRGRGLDAAKTSQQAECEPGSQSLPVSPTIQVGGGSKPPLVVDSQPELTGSNQGVQSSATSGHRLFPIFLMGTSKAGGFPHSKPCPTDWRSLLLPSSPPSQTPLLPQPSLPWSSAVNFDVPLDFHLPDDQFASLKLHKLRQVAEDRGLESFSSPSYNTRRSIRQYESLCSQPPPSPILLPFSPTPTVSNPSNPNAAAQCPEPPTSEGLGPKGSVRSSQRPSGSDRSETEVVWSGAAGLAGCPLVPEDQCEGRDTENSSSHTSEFNTHAETRLQRDCTTDESDVATDENHGRAAEDAGVEPCSTSSAAQNHCTDAAVGPPLEVDSAEGGADQPKGSPEATQAGTISALQPHGVHTQLLLSPPPTSAPRQPCSALPNSLDLPSLGLSPPVDPLTCSPSAPTLTLPPPPPPADTLPLSPPPLSPAPPPSPGQAPALSAEPQQAWHEAPDGDQLSAVETSDQRMGETEPRLFKSCTHTLKSPAGGSLVDACCLPGTSGGLCVAAAGKWAVCLWSQTAPSDWTLVHTWSFSEPVISVLAVPDAAGLILVTLGRLEIREVRMLSSSRLSQTLVCKGLVQAVVALSSSRVVCSLHLAVVSTLQLFQLSDSRRPIQPQHLVAPDVCVRALAPVDGLPDALIGTDEGGLLFIWNLKTGQMLQQILLCDGSSNLACVRAYTSYGVLLVLLQHQLLGALEEVGEEQDVGVTVRRTSWLSLLAVNPLNGRSVLAGHLYPPETWSGRLCEVDADAGGSVVGLSQSGCVCVWELGSGGTTGGSSMMVGAPESEGCLLARWGRGGMLVTGHHNGDVTLHCGHSAPCSARGEGFGSQSGLDRLKVGF